MVNIFNSSKINSLLLSSILVIFSLAVLTPPPCHAQWFDNITPNDIAFGIRIEKLIEKVWKYKDKGDSDKLLDTMVEIKQVVEGHTGKKIDLDKQIDQVEVELKNKGAKVPKKDLKALRKRIKSKEKKANHRALCMASYIEDPSPSYSFEEYETLYRAAHGNPDRQDEEQQAAELPLRLTIGVTVALCGLFLCFVPIPICKAWGADLMKAGVTLAVEGYVNRQEEDKDKKDKR